VEWVEVTGRTLEEAKEHALDQLGVAEADAEIIVLGEPKAGLFGRMRGEARVRARVRPVGPRPRRTRRPPRERSRGSERQGGGRNGRSGSGGGGRQGGGSSTGTATVDDREGAAQSSNRADTPSGSAASGSQSRSRRRRGGRGRGGRGSGSGGGNGAANGETSRANGRDRSVGGAGNGSRSSASGANGESEGDMAEGMTLEEQGEIARNFLAGLVEELGLEATVAVRVIDEETVEVSASGDELGILVGPRGSTLTALQDVTRTVVQRHCPSRTDRILVDVAGYRQKRAEALQRFTNQIAGEVIESGTERALEAMSPADRKTVHDAANLLDGVVTRSEGEDPQRFVVIAPAG
jgi:spoIIIJ-associated protein